MTQPCPSLPTPLRHLKQLLGPLVEESAARMKAFQRSRKIESVWQLLWLLMIYCTCNYSMGQLVELFASRFGTISETAITNRVKKSEYWLAFLVEAVLKKRAELWSQPSRRIVLVDSTCVRSLRDASAITKAIFSVDLMSLCTAAINVHLGQSGERFDVTKFDKLSTFVGDSGFCRQKTLQSALLDGHHFVVRHKDQGINLYHKSGRKFSLDSLFSQVAPEGTLYTAELQLPFANYKGIRGKYCPDTRKGLWPVYLHALRLPKDEADRQVKRLKSDNKKKGKKTSARSIFVAKWIILLTSYPPDELLPHQAIELYGFRWQIELVFRRLKQTMELVRSRAQSQGKLHQSFLYACFLMHLLMEEHVSLIIDPNRHIILNGDRSLDRYWPIFRDEWAAELLTFYPKRKNADQELHARQGKRRARCRSQTPSPELVRWMFEKDPKPPLNISRVA